ncbi:hypothetical protein vseg_018006 [Gypsophila vaccaria]
MLGRRTKAISVDADYLVDVKKYRAAMNRGGDGDWPLGSDLKRRRGRGFSGREDIKNDDDDRFEKDYVAFLLDLEEFDESRVIKEEDLDDPDYMMFLDNLKVRGNSYVLNKSIEHGVPLRIMYEVEEIHYSAEIRRVSPRRGLDEYAQRKRNFLEEINRRNVRSRGVNGTQKARTRGESMKRKRSCSRGEFYAEEVRTSVASEDTLSDFDIIAGMSNRMTKSVDEVIEEKRIVGEVVKRRKLRSRTGNHVQEKIRKLNVDNSLHFGSESFASRKMKIKSVTFNYRQEELKTKKKTPNCHGSDYFPAEQVSGVPNNSRPTPKTSPLKKTVIDEVYKRFMENFKVKGESCVYEYGDKKFVYYDLRSDSRHPSNVTSTSSDRLRRDHTVEADSSTQPDAIVAATSDHLPNDWPLTIAADSGKQQPVTVANTSSGHLPNDWSLAIDTVSQPITVAPPSRDQARRQMVFGLSSIAPSRKKRPVPFRKERPLPLPSSVQVATQSQPTQPSMSFVPAPRLAMTPFDKQLGSNLEGSHRVPAVMREKLLKILRRPYSKQEHDLLWKEVNHRSAVMIHRDSRSGGSDRPGHMGRSLLDWNPDVSREIDKVKSEPHKVLNLLRMLAFYIQKQPCGRICKPWMDKTLMTILHGSS